MFILKVCPYCSGTKVQLLKKVGKNGEKLYGKDGKRLLEEVPCDAEGCIEGKTINPELIETIETTPDTILTLTSGKKYVVKESPEELIKRFIKYQQFVRRPFNEKAADAGNK